MADRGWEVHIYIRFHRCGRQLSIRGLADLDDLLRERKYQQGQESPRCCISGCEWRTVYQFFEQPSASGFDSDRGIKDKAALCFGTDFHTRIYAPSATDYVYTTKFGYMVIGSTHKDHNDGCHGSYYDQNEQTEYRVWATILNARGQQVSSPVVPTSSGTKTIRIRTTTCSTTTGMLPCSR